MTTVKTDEPQALVFGASGITGWAIINAALSYPTPTTFKRIVGLTSRPLSVEDAGLPTDQRLRLYSGLDLSKDSQSIIDYLGKIENIQEITHVYFAGKPTWPPKLLGRQLTGWGTSICPSWVGG